MKMKIIISIIKAMEKNKILLIIMKKNMKMKAITLI